MLTEYLDWSDFSVEKEGTLQSKGKFAEFTFWLEDGSLILNLRRNTRTRRDLTITINDPKELYKLLKEHFEE